MFATCGTTTPLGQATRQQRSLAFRLLAWFALSSSLVLLSGCGTQGSSKSAVTAPVAQAQSVRQVRVHLAPAPTIFTTVRVAQRHLYTFSTSDVGLMQPAVDAQGNVWVGEMHANRLGCLNSQTGVVTSWTPLARSMAS
jgi:streptogramin lyase